MAFRAEVDMTIFEQDVVFTFSGSEDGFMGEIVFPNGFNVGDTMKGVWTLIAGDEDSYPFGEIDIEIKKITGLMKEDKENHQSIVMWSIQVEEYLLTIYFVKPSPSKKGTTKNNEEKDKQVQIFSLEKIDGFVMESLPGVNTKLEKPISANFKALLSSDKASFSIAGKQINVKKGFTATAELDLPPILKADINTATGINVQFYSDGGNGKKPLSPSENPAQKALAQQKAIEEAEILEEQEEGEALGLEALPIKWKKVDKKLFKVANIHRVGFMFQTKEREVTKGKKSAKKETESYKVLSVHLDMDVKVSVVQIGLLNLHVSFDISKMNDISKAFSFGLDGLGIGIQTQAFTLAGLLYRDTVIVKKKEKGKTVTKEYTQYIGSLVLKTKQFSAAGLGAYGKIDGYQSFFFYLFIGVPIGGPPYFFVNGLALGFGYNRQVKIPDINGVADFPFVRLAMGKAEPDAPVMSMLVKMIPIIVETFPPQKGSLFFAIGVKFNSVKLLDGFALLLVTIGDKFRIDVLGLLMLIIPKEKPVAVIELAIKVSFIPADGVISVEGYITESSYVISKKAKLQGGFALYVWIKDVNVKGKNVSAGEFVLTIGGYHPKFAKPEYYPSVPRVGLNWQVTDDLSVKALAYFALTPVAVMVGLEISAIYTSKKLKVWFIVSADFLVQWNPFYYDISIRVEIGVKYKTWIKTFNLSLRASLEIWGPEFSGKATVKICGISKTIKFGAGQPQLTPKISWFKFKDELIPEAVMTTKMQEGMLSESKKEGVTTYKTDSKHAVVSIDSFIPMTSVTGVEYKEKVIGGKLNVYPVGKTATAPIVIDVKYIGTANGSKEQLEVSLGTKYLPKAMWSEKHNLGLNEGEATIEKTVQVILEAKTKDLAESDIPHIGISKVPPFDEKEWGGIWSIEKLGTSEPILDNKFGVFNEKFEEFADTSKANIQETFGLRASPIFV